MAQSGGLLIQNYLVKTDEADYILASETLIGVSTTFDKVISQPGNEGKTYRFRVAAQNVLGTGPYSDELQLMATDAPQAPSISYREETRTLTSVTIDLSKPVLDGGSPISGYQLYRDQGISGSPFQMIYDGTDRPELLSVVAEGLQTSLTYTFKAYSMNKIFVSDLHGELVIKIGMVPS